MYKPMKISILTMIGFSLLSLSAFAADDCLRYFSNADRASIIMKKTCSVIIRDHSNKPVKTVSACLTKLENQFQDKISYGLVADLIHDDANSSKGIMIVNTIKAAENQNLISIDLTTASPELFWKKTRNILVFNKLNKTLSLVKKTKGVFTSWKEQYNLELQCD